jgi:hypothetical protein
MSYAEALAADRAGRLTEAADAYEQQIANGERSLELLLDLASLYWQATDIGTITALDIPRAFLNRAYARCRELLTLASSMYPHDREALFWEQYIRFIDLNGVLDLDALREMVRADPPTLVAVLPLFGESEGLSFVAEAQQLLDLARSHGTTRSRYVSSVLEAIMAQTAHQERLRRAREIES